jgi:DNA-binding IclR family transcriptional regulator
VRDPQAEPSDLIRSVSRALRVMEAVGQSDRGLTVKQIARRCQLTVATTYHLVRTLAYEGYVIRREDGTYVVGLEIADRFRELVAAFRGPVSVLEALRRAAGDLRAAGAIAELVIEPGDTPSIEVELGEG